MDEIKVLREMAKGLSLKSKILYPLGILLLGCGSYFTYVGGFYSAQSKAMDLALDMAEEKPESEE